MIIDSHVHLFPDRLADAVRAWFAEHAWPCRYLDRVDALVARLREGGIDRMVALPYAHKPGMSRALNAFTLEVARAHPEVIPCCTVFPGEEGDEAILDEALGRDGFAGVKLHCHVMKLAPDDARMEPVFRASARYRRPIVIHAGKEPALQGYGLDVHAVSGAARLRRVLERHPDAIVIVPHLGGDEYEAFGAMLGEFPNLYLDTAMVVGGYFERMPDLAMLREHPDRILYGTDFPNLPYDWTSERDVIRALALPAEDEAKIFAGNALRLFGAA